MNAIDVLRAGLVTLDEWEALDRLARLVDEMAAVRERLRNLGLDTESVDAALSDVLGEGE